MSDYGVSIKDAFPFWCMSVSRLQTFIVVSKFLLSLVLNLRFASLFVHSGKKNYVINDTFCITIYFSHISSGRSLTTRSNLALLLSLSWLRKAPARAPVHASEIKNVWSRLFWLHEDLPSGIWVT